MQTLRFFECLDIARARVLVAIALKTPPLMHAPLCRPKFLLRSALRFIVWVSGFCSVEYLNGPSSLIPRSLRYSQDCSPNRLLSYKTKEPLGDSSLELGLGWSPKGLKAGWAERAGPARPRRVPIFQDGQPLAARLRRSADEKGKALTVFF